MSEGGGVVTSDSVSGSHVHLALDAGNAYWTDDRV